jgi:hypothetical protein
LFGVNGDSQLRNYHFDTGCHPPFGHFLDANTAKSGSLANVITKLKVWNLNQALCEKRHAISLFYEKRNAGRCLATGPAPDDPERSGLKRPAWILFE